MNNNFEEMQLAHYKKFLLETAKTLGMDAQDLADIEGFQTPAQVNNFIDFLVDKYGVKVQITPPVSVQQLMDRPTFLPDTRQRYNEWETPDE